MQENDSRAQGVATHSSFEAPLGAVVNMKVPSCDVRREKDPTNSPQLERAGGAPEPVPFRPPLKRSITVTDMQVTRNVRFDRYVFRPFGLSFMMIQGSIQAPLEAHPSVNRMQIPA